MLDRFLGSLAALVPRNLGRSGKETSGQTLPRRHLPQQPDIIYAIGDVHGCIGPLRKLEELIAADIARSAGEKLVVMLGDYVDRGPDSAGVLDHLLAATLEGVERVCLLGNHEQLMLDVLERRESLRVWLELGGEQTIRSYGFDVSSMRPQAGLGQDEIMDGLGQAIPQAHIAMLKAMPVSLTTPHHIFAHAGIRPGVELDRQSDTDLLWRRNGPATGRPHPDKVVVHGHTPSSRVIWPGRICVDTGACFGGELTAARISAGSVDIISVKT